MSTGLDDKLHWYKDAIIYELHIKAFYDGNGDGIGDFKGLRQKLTYLQDLGVTAIWLLPFYPSPLRDDGYDISDYYNIHPSYGDVNEFKLFLKEAHDLNLRVITELVINHTSDQHPWFQRARNAPKDSEHRNFYVWSDDPNQYSDTRIIFQDFEKSNWTWDPVAQQYFWHRFFFHQPDLNYNNVQVQNEVLKIIDFWCEMGVDGFRLDAVPYLFEKEGTNSENLPETHVFLKKVRKYVDDKYPGTLLLAEANMWPEDSVSYFGNGDECQMNYHFPAMPRMFMALQTEDRYPITDIFDQTPAIPETCQWAIFLRNHDELTLEMVTDEERDYMYKVYVKDPKARINLGIRHRLAPLMNNNRNKIELLNYLLLSLPGTPVIYYGDEIGMGDNFYLGDRDGVRTPMQWSPDRNAGFSKANPHKLYLPIILDPDYHYGSVNVELQVRNTSSLWWWTKRLITKRKNYKAFGRGDMKFIACDNAKILAFTRTYEDQSILVVINLSRYTQPAELDLSAYKGYTPVGVFSSINFPQVKEDAAYFLTMGEHHCEWFLLEKAHQATGDADALPELSVASWEGLASRPVMAELEDRILPAYLQQLRWFGGKARKVENIRITNVAELPTESSKVFVLLVEVNYQEGLPELYQLPVALANQEIYNQLKTDSPKALIAALKLKDEQNVFLFDAVYSNDFRVALIKNLINGSFIKQTEGELRFYGHQLVNTYQFDVEKLKSKILSAEQSNTSIIYGNEFFLKLFRKVDRATNPDLEISRFLTTHAKFEHISGFVGSVEWNIDNQCMALAMIQEVVEKSSDAWKYMLDRLDDFNEKILATPEKNQLPPLRGTLLAPVSFEEMPAVLKDLMGAALAESATLLGVRTGEMHIALSSSIELPDFRPEPYSLHYQRSLFSGLQSLVRGTFQNQKRNIEKLSPDVKKEAEEVLDLKDQILTKLKDIYNKRIKVNKIRVHGDYHLGQVMFTGKDFIITDFEGEPARSFSERRLKRSPFRDIAGMIRSFHYAAYGSLFLNQHVRKEDHERLIPYIEQWYHYMSGLFMKAYLKTVKGYDFVPKDDDGIQTLLTTFLLEKAIYELNYEINNRPEWVIIPLRGIKALMRTDLNSESVDQIVSQTAAIK